MAPAQEVNPHSKLALAVGSSDVRLSGGAPEVMNYEPPLRADVSRVYDLEDVTRLWCDLQSLACPHFFLSWTWIGSWLAMVLPTTPVWLFTARRGDQVVAAALLTRDVRPRLRGRLQVRQVQVNEFLAPGFDMVMGYNGLLTVPGVEEASWRAFLKMLSEWGPEWDELALCALSGREVQRLEATIGDLRVVHDKSFPSWVVDLSPLVASPGDPIRLLKRKSRQQLRQSRRAFAERGALSIRPALSLGEAHCMFDKLGAMHTQRWQAAGRRGAFANLRWVAFHRQIIDQAFETGTAQLLETRVGGEPVGYLYGHVFGDTVFMQQTGFARSDNNRLRSAHVSHVEAMRYYAERGIRRYDLLPDEAASYKRFFTSPGPPVHWVQVQRPRKNLAIERSLRTLRDHLRN
jgi:hypothetical protein